MTFRCQADWGGGGGYMCFSELQHLPHKLCQFLVWRKYNCCKLIGLLDAMFGIYRSPDCVLIIFFMLWKVLMFLLLELLTKIEKEQS